ncbi:MAG: hypothetical protein L0227_06315 [Chloroflexi bacterium]|nr:hypothetical protein [Chloroflexota bacterium]
MAYDPALTAFIIVGLVGGVAVVMSAAPGWETSHELARATDGWTAPVVSRTYALDARARQRLRREAEVLEGHGYRAVLRREVGGAPPTGEPPAAPSDPAIVVTYRLS